MRIRAVITAGFFLAVGIAGMAVPTVASAAVAQPAAVSSAHPNVTGVPIKEASGSFCLRDGGGDNANVHITEGSCGSGAGENLAFESNGGSFEGFTTGEFHFTSQTAPEICVGVDAQNTFVITQFCSGVNGVVFIEKPKNGAFLIISRPCTQQLGADCMVTGNNQANASFFVATSSIGFQRFINN